MTALRTALKFRLYSSPLYRPARLAFLAICDRQKLAALRRAEQFYRPFIQPGDLVFDVGANLGQYTETFAVLGARVVAIEPHPGLSASLRGLERRWSVQVEPLAVGACAGTATLHVCDSRSDISTLSDTWRTVHGLETRPVSVPVTTVDALAERYGFPHFVKIDTEGFDDQVVAGMSFHPRLVSFELLAVQRDVALRVLDQLGDTYTYSLTLGERFALDPQWREVGEMQRHVAAVDCPEGYGDVIAQRR